VTPEELAATHPTLFHVTRPEAWPKIKELGLLSTCALLYSAVNDGTVGVLWSCPGSMSPHAYCMLRCRHENQLIP
jgi:hypothetical protein